ncbi:MAG TPA: 2-isopropylmalate synthase [Limnobacter sp.]|uniref:2-isopropylmalate synthase n=1 Tax=Limnobacter sp. TaxID=2003368 RepID=UPI002EDAA8B6
MLANPATKYRRAYTVDMPNRQWPNQQIEKAPVWLSTDLRDGNQAIFEPMSVVTKLRFFSELVKVGFKEIETGFPAASQIDFDVIRTLIDEGRIPDDVTPMVMTQARDDLIERTVQSVIGAKRAIIHIYNSTAPVWRNTVFRMTVPEVIDMVRQRVQTVKRLTDAHPETEWVLQYSPECFNMTELDVALQACNTAIDTWNAGPGRPVIINLPTTVEWSTPNVFADQIEWMDARLNRRAHVVLSVHPHNDRGTGVATAELAMMAGAQRVEGCLFGNGERCGNVDIVTLALNMYTQGVHPGLDFSNINAIARVVEECTQLPIHPRHPYVGDLVYTAFSGSHQDAIKKGFDKQIDGGIWEVPYLPIDPKDVGRTYDSVIRVNSQSGKGGIAYILEREHGVVMPRRMQVEFSAVVQQESERTEKEVSSTELWGLFQRTYLTATEQGAVQARFHEQGSQTRAVLQWQQGEEAVSVEGIGNGPVDAAVNALQQQLGPFNVVNYEERSQGQGAQAKAVCIIEASSPHMPAGRFGVGIDDNIVMASVKALMSVVHRLGLQAAVHCAHD